MNHVQVDMTSICIDLHYRCTSKSNNSSESSKCEKSNMSVRQLHLQIYAQTQNHKSVVNLQADQQSRNQQEKRVAEEAPVYAYMASSE